MEYSWDKSRDMEERMGKYRSRVRGELGSVKQTHQKKTVGQRGHIFFYLYTEASRRFILGPSFASNCTTEDKSMRGNSSRTGAA